MFIAPRTRIAQFYLQGWVDSRSRANSDTHGLEVERSAQTLEHKEDNKNTQLTKAAPGARITTQRQGNVCLFVFASLSQTLNVGANGQRLHNTRKCDESQLGICG